jgi:hypothetical protein
MAAQLASQKCPGQNDGMEAIRACYERRTSVDQRQNQLVVAEEKMTR